jgi:integrase
VLFAAFSGLRLGDLVRVTWADVGEKAITLTTAKSRGKRVVIVPITPKLQAILKQIGRKDVGAVLTHSRGLPWTAWGIQTAMQRRKTAKGVKGLRFHDLRGTAATHFARSLPLADVARIMGWTPQRVDAIAARYVTAEAVAEGMLKRLKGNK